MQAVVNELGGERIDIVPWSSDPERFAKLALAPAKVARVFSDGVSKTIQAVVDEDQLSLAIGRNGQNVRLASELTGWKIDLYSSREWLEKGGGRAALRAAAGRGESDEAADVPLAELAGMHPATVAVLERGGLSHAERHHRSRARGFPAARRHRAGRGGPHHVAARRADDRGRRRRRARCTRRRAARAD